MICFNGKITKMVSFVMIFLLITCYASFLITAEASTVSEKYHKGDIDGDSLLTNADYLLIKKSFLGEHDLEAKEAVMADIDNNGIIDSTDYLMLKSHFLGKTTISKDGFFSGEDVSKFNQGVGEETFMRIKNDYLSLSPLYSQYTVADVDITCFSGSYNGAYVMMIAIRDSLALDVYIEKEIGGVMFTFPTNRELQVWKDGAFHSLEEAYEQGILTTCDLGIARGVYRIGAVI